jgi:group I intron endonuclease
MQPQRKSLHLYVITNRVTGKKYVGQTSGLEHRIQAHISCREDSLLARAIKKHGLDAFELVFATLPEFADRALLDELERRLIRHFGTIHPAGYNILPGGHRGEHHPETIEKIRASKLGKPRSAETIAKMRASMKASPACRGWVTPEAQRAALRERFQGKPLSAEHCAKLKAAWIKRKAEGKFTKSISPEQRAKISAANTGKSPSSATRAKISATLKGRPLSAETCAKMSATRKGRKHSEAHRLALCGHPCKPETKAKISAKKRERDALRKASAA